MRKGLQPPRVVGPRRFKELVDIGQGAFSLRENGANVASPEIAELRNTMDSISVIFALDTSAGMSGHTMDDAKTALHIFSDMIQPGDHVSLITFGGSAQIVVPYTVSKRSFLDGVDRQEAGDKRALADVFPLAAGLAHDQPQGGFTVLVIITNGDLPKPRDRGPGTGPRTWR